MSTGMDTNSYPTDLGAEQMLDTEAAARWLGIAGTTLRDWQNRPWRGPSQGPPPAYRLGRRYRYRVSDLEAWLQTTRVGGGPTT